MACIKAEMNMSFVGVDFNSSLNSFTASSRYVKKVIRITILNILYRRLQMEESNFLKKDFYGISYRMQKKNCRDQIIRSYTMAMQEIYNAVDKKYLKNVYLLMKDPKNNDVKEIYNWSVKYILTNKKEQEDPSVFKKMVTKGILQFLATMRELPKLDKNIIPYFEFSYNNSAPDDYVPVHCKKSDNTLCHLYNTGSKLPYMTLRTGYHYVKDSICEKLNVNTEIPQPLHRKSFDLFFNKFSSPHKSLIEDDKSASNVFPMDMDEMPNLTPQMNCVCGLNDANLEADVLTCIKCKNRSHLSCNGCLDEPIDGYNCFFCNPNQDQILFCLREGETQHMARIRLCLVSMSRNKRLPEEMLELFGEDDRQKIMNEFKDLNIIVEDNSGRINISEKILDYRMTIFFDKF